MSEIRTMLLDSASRLFTDHCDRKMVDAAKASGWSQSLWDVLEDAELPRVGVPEAAGGAGGTLVDCAAVVRLAGEYCAPVPLAETAMLAGWMLATSGLEVPRGPLASAPAHLGESLRVGRTAQGWQLSGSLRRVPWARIAARLVVLAHGADRDYVVNVDPRAATITPGQNLAREPRDDVRFDAVRVPAGDVVPAGHGVTAQALFERGALSRALMMAGALDRCLMLSVRYAAQRVQFGRPIGRFQAIQQELARLAGEVAAAGAAASSAASVLEQGAGAFAVASAKIRAGEAAHAGSAIAHQVHGAIGATEEYELHQATTRLWAWRSEYGTEAEWADDLGRRVLRAGGRCLWSTLTEL